VNVRGQIFCRIEQSQKSLAAQAGSRFTSPTPGRNLLVPGPLVIGPNCPFDLGVLDHEEPPTLHISAARRTNTHLHTSAFPIRRRAELACPTAWIKPQLAVLIKNAPDGENLITLPLLERNARLASLLKGAPGLLQYNDHQIGDGSAQRAMGNRFLPGQDRIAISRNITGLDFLVISRSRPIS
jgi:hypothetical protein